MSRWPAGAGTDILSDVTLENWVWESNVRRFVEWVARWTNYSFDDSDWQAIETALPETDAWGAHRWYDYPISGEPMLILHFARDP